MPGSGFREVSVDGPDEVSGLSFLVWSDFEVESVKLAVCVESPCDPMLSDTMNPNTVRATAAAPPITRIGAMSSTRWPAAWARGR